MSRMNDEGCRRLRSAFEGILAQSERPVAVACDMPPKGEKEKIR